VEKEGAVPARFPERPDIKDFRTVPTDRFPGTSIAILVWSTKPRAGPRPPQSRGWFRAGKKH